MHTLISAIAGNLQRLKNNNRKIEIDAGNCLDKLQRLLPSGAGIDHGTKIDLEKSKPEKIVFIVDYHHMNSNGFYDGWTTYTITVKPSFVYDIDVTVSGRDRNETKDYLAEVFSQALTETLQSTYNSDLDEFSYTVVYGK